MMLTGAYLYKYVMPDAFAYYYCTDQSKKVSERECQLEKIGRAVCFFLGFAKKSTTCVPYVRSIRMIVQYCTVQCVLHYCFT